jgi:hypothetical protein
MCYFSWLRRWRSGRLFELNCLEAGRFYDRCGKGSLARSD